MSWISIMLSAVLVVGYILIVILVVFSLYTYTICNQSKWNANNLLPVWLGIGLFWPITFTIALIIYMIYYLIKWSRIEVLADKLAEKCHEYKSKG